MRRNAESLTCFTSFLYYKITIQIYLYNFLLLGKVAVGGGCGLTAPYIVIAMTIKVASAVIYVAGGINESMSFRVLSDFAYCRMAFGDGVKGLHRAFVITTTLDSEFLATRTLKRHRITDETTAPRLATFCHSLL